MAKRYLVAMQQPWGREVFDRVRDQAGAWWACFGGSADLENALLPTSGDDFRYVFLLNWSDRIPREIFERWECVNFHCTALPYGRGGHPVENLLLSGIEETVMTAHRVVEEIDAGPVYWRYGPVSLAGRTKAEILAGFVAPCVSLIQTIVEREPAPDPQEGQVVRFSRLSDEAFRRFWREREQRP